MSIVNVIISANTKHVLRFSFKLRLISNEQLVIVLHNDTFV